MMKSKIIIAGVAALALSACSTANPYTGQSQISNTAGGATIGAAGGAIGGALISAATGGDARIGALIGAGIGALGGGVVGNYMDQQEAELRAQLQGSGISVTRSGHNIILNMPSNITFDVGRSAVKPRFEQTLNSVALVLQKFNRTIVDIYGYTDATGSEESNLKLSLERASAVATYVSSRGVDARRFYIDGRGEAQPIASNSSEAGRAQNRRVEIRIAPITQG